MNSKISKSCTSKARLYLVGAIVSALVACATSIPLTPAFLKLFVSFPSLEEAEVISGTVEVVGESSLTGGRPATYFMVNSNGRHQVFCGLPTARLRCFGDDLNARGATGTVWLHPTFGLLQWDLTFHTSRADGYREFRSYQVKKDYFENKFDFQPYQARFFAVFIALAKAVYQFVKFRALCANEIGQNEGKVA